MKISKLGNEKSVFRNIITICSCMLLTAIMLPFTGCSSDDDDKTVYTVIFETDGGTPTPSVQRVEEGSTATAPTTNPTKVGYAFVFWYLDGATTAYNFNTPISKDITLFAKWQEEATAEYWQVTWNLNGGTWPSGDNHTTRVVKGGTLAEPVAPTKEGNTFNGWYKEAAFKNKITFPCEVMSDFKLYAKWETEGEEPDYGAKADYFGTWRDMRWQELESWDQFTISSDKIIMMYGTGDFITLENLTWVETVNQSYGDRYDPDPAAEYPNGYRISGTLTGLNGISFPKEDGSRYAAVGDVLTIGFYLPASGKESIKVEMLFPDDRQSWGPYSINNSLWQVQWNLNGGAWAEDITHYPATQTPKGETFVRVPTNPTKEGYNFRGWYTNAALSGDMALFPYDVKGETSDIAFYARWTDASPSATLNVTVTPAPGQYTFITAMRLTPGTPSQYSIPTNFGTHEVKVSPGTYYISVTYWACPTVNCMSTGRSGQFTIETGETKNIIVTNSSIAL